MPGTFSVAVSSIIEYEGKILIARRAQNRDFAPNIWEFPAGRLEPGESPYDALKRELKEELNLDSSDYEIIMPYFTYYMNRNGQDTIVICFAVRLKEKTHLQKSSEHSELQWVVPHETFAYLAYETQKKDLKHYLDMKRRCS